VGPLYESDLTIHGSEIESDGMGEKWERREVNGERAEQGRVFYVGRTTWAKAGGQARPRTRRETGRASPDGSPY